MVETVMVTVVESGGLDGGNDVELETFVGGGGNGRGCGGQW